MKKVAIINLDKWEKLPFKIAQKLTEDFKSKYGYKLISKEDNKELNLFTEFGTNALTGFLSIMLDKRIREYLGD